MRTMKRWFLIAVALLVAAVTEGTVATCHASLAENIVQPPAGSTQAEEISKIESQWDELVTYAALSDLGRRQAQTETARTDKQTGASASTAGTTTLAVKPGLSELLALAIEEGAVEQSNNATSITLRTSPYLFMTGFGTEDTAESYRKYWFWRMFEVHVSYPVATDERTDFEAKEVVDWGTRIRLLGDRSPRSPLFIRLWNERVKRLVQEHADALTGAIVAWQQDPDVRRRNDEELQQTMAKITAYLGSTGDSDAVKIGKVQEILDQGVERMSLLAKPAAAPFQAMIPALTSMEEGGRARQELLAIMDEVAKSPLLTIEYIDQRNEHSSDVSYLLLEYQSRVEPLDLVVNARSAFYHDPHLAGRDSSVKEYGATVALEWRGNNFLFKPSDATDLSQLTVSGGGAVSHVEGFSGIRGAAQLRLEIPIRKGVTLPLALSYATRTDASNKSEVRGNFGLTMDWTKLLAGPERY